MNKNTFSRHGQALLVLCCALLVPHTFGFAQDMPLAQLKAGQTGFSLTAGAGNKLERFEVQVLDTVDDPRGFPLVLVRGSGAFLDAVGGIGQGFSGSPVYIGGKLLGAISGGFPNADHRLALVTPISAMRRAQTPSTALELALPFAQPRACFADLGCAKDFALPLMSFGLTPSAAEMLVSSLSAKGFQVSLAQNSSTAQSDQPRPYKLEPGAAIAAQLSTGDIALGAIGTVTAIEQDRILAFGHPVLGDLRARYIAMPAYISAIVPSSVVPYKVGSPTGTPLGDFLIDHPAAVAGNLGAVTSLPLEVSLKTARSERKLNINLAPIGDIYASLVLAVLASAIEQTLAGSSPGLARLSIRLAFAERDPITIQEVVAGENVARVAALRGALMTALISENPYRDPRLTKISLALELEQYNTLRLIKLEPEKKTLEPNELGFINMRLQAYRGSAVVKRISYKAPSEPGQHRLRVRGGATPRPKNELENPDPWDGVLTLDSLLERLRSRLKDVDALVETTEPRIVGIERFDVPVTGWAYFDITVVEK
ncbi:MAG: hypothetical protein ACK41E_03395 [Deinococcales bacterium]